MITRIEIDGFKSFLDFQLDVPPFLALVGPNASGKSNLLDAIAFQQACQRSPSSALLEARRGGPNELFHRVAKGAPVEEFSINVRRLLGFPEGLADIEGIVKAELVTGVPRASFCELTTHAMAEQPDLAPHIREREWRLVEADLEPEAYGSLVDTYFDMVGEAFGSTGEYVPEPRVMRGLARAADMRPLMSDGRNLAAVLGRMSRSDALDDLVVDLVSLIPDVTEIKAELGEKRQEWSFDLVVEGQGAVPSSLLSDGTLRVLGLLAALHDPDHSGMLMVEEIENGLHPARLAELLRRIQERVTDLTDPESLDRPLRQVIVTSHSPVVVSELYQMRPESLVFMDTVVRVDPDNDRVSRVSVAKPVRDEGEPGTFVSPRQVREYLGTVRQDAP